MDGHATPNVVIARISSIGQNDDGDDDDGSFGRRTMRRGKRKTSGGGGGGRRGRDELDGKVVTNPPTAGIQARREVESIDRYAPTLKRMGIHDDDESRSGCPHWSIRP